MTKQSGPVVSKTLSHDQRSLKQKAHEQFNTFLSDCGIANVAGKCLLEIGFGNGLFLKVCKSHGLQAAGTEINKDHYRKAKAKYPDLDLLLCEDQTIPLADERFDYIVSFQVLEHVGEPETIVNESVRLLKPGGTMYHICPNYASFYEGHYKVMWLPFFTQRIGRCFLKLRGKYSPYYETLNLVKPGTVRRLFKKHGAEIEIISLGKAEFMKKFSRHEIDKIDQKMVRGFFRVLDKWSFLKKGCLRLIAALGWYYPLTIIAKKRI